MVGTTADGCIGSGRVLTAIRYRRDAIILVSALRALEVAGIGGVRYKKTWQANDLACPRSLFLDDSTTALGVVSPVDARLYILANYP